jgi:hypothetical protein
MFLRGDVITHDPLRWHTMVTVLNLDTIFAFVNKLTSVPCLTRLPRLSSQHADVIIKK